jgi:hypothetical protein
LGVVPEHTEQLLPFPPQSLAVMPVAQKWLLVQQPVPPQLPQFIVPPHPFDTEPHCPAVHVSGVHPQTPAVPPPPHVLGAVQSVLLTHPQVPAEVHTCPAGEVAQSTHDPPLGPHAVCVVPL